ncbi:MAG: lectin [Proteobacteria bacterium]|nr:lectin [Pseudomonadota bacterium]
MASPATTALGITVAAMLLVLPARAQTPSDNISFFVTSVGIGNGGDLGGLAGADAHCAFLAAAAGVAGKTWRAYLSRQPLGPQPEINARDRIGPGPWFNAAGVLIAADVAALHGAGNNISKATALTEQGEIVNGLGDEPNRHDILTGTTADGMSYDEDYDRTCGNWTSNGPGEVMVGHHDLRGVRWSGPSTWNNAHLAGCSQGNFARTGGAGLFYCFALPPG